MCVRTHGPSKFKPPVAETAAQMTLAADLQTRRQMSMRSKLGELRQFVRTVGAVNALKTFVRLRDFGAYGSLKGCDQFGNCYFEKQNTHALRTRFVVFGDAKNYDGSDVPPEWCAVACNPRRFKSQSLLVFPCLQVRMAAPPGGLHASRSKIFIATATHCVLPAQFRQPRSLSMRCGLCSAAPCGAGAGMGASARAQPAQQLRPAWLHAPRSVGDLRSASLPVVFKRARRCLLQDTRCDRRRCSDARTTRLCTVAGSTNNVRAFG